MIEPNLPSPAPMDLEALLEELTLDDLTDESPYDEYVVDDVN